MILTALSCGTVRADGSGPQDFLNYFNFNANKFISILAVAQGHGDMHDRGLDQLLPSANGLNSLQSSDLMSLHLKCIEEEGNFENL